MDLGTDLQTSERMVFPLWKSLHSLNLMLPKEDRRALLLRLFNDDTPLVNLSHKQTQRQISKAKAEIEPAHEPEGEDHRRNSSSEDEGKTDEVIGPGQPEMITDVPEASSVAEPRTTEE
jgi:multisite-specific tRNA:(cytosine-C5)-methyltransferase